MEVVFLHGRRVAGHVRVLCPQCSKAVDAGIRQVGGRGPYRVRDFQTYQAAHKTVALQILAEIGVLRQIQLVKDLAAIVNCATARGARIPLRSPSSRSLVL